MGFVRRATCVALFVFAAFALAFGAHEPSYAAEKFEKLFAGRIGRLWYANMEAYHKQLVPGVVRIQVTISAERKILQLLVLSNTSNKLAARLSVDAIRRAEVRPIPSKLLIRGAFDIEYTFKIYPN